MAGIKITGTFYPSGNFPLLEDKHLKGGFRVVPTYADLSNIPELDLKVGMLVKVNENGITYEYKGNGVWEEYTMASTSEAGASAISPSSLKKLRIPPVVTGVDTLPEIIKQAWGFDIDLANSHLYWPVYDGGFYTAGTWSNLDIFTIQTDGVIKGNTRVVIFTNAVYVYANFGTTRKFYLNGIKVSDSTSVQYEFNLTPIAENSVWHIGEVLVPEDIHPTGISVSRAFGSYLGAVWLCSLKGNTSITLPEIEAIIDKHRESITPGMACIYRYYDHEANAYKYKYETTKTGRVLITKSYIDAVIRGHNGTIEVVDEFNLSFTTVSNYNNELLNLQHMGFDTTGISESDLDKTNHSGDDNNLIVDSVDGETPYIKLINNKYIENKSDKAVRKVIYVEWLIQDGHEYNFNTYVKYLLPDGSIQKTYCPTDLSDCRDEIGTSNLTFRFELLIPPKAKIVEFGAQYYAGVQWKIYFAEPGALEWKGSYFKIKDIDRILNDVSQSTDPSRELLTYNAIQSLLGNTTKGIKWKAPVRAIATENIDLANLPSPLVIDGVTIEDGDRVALFGQDNAVENGIYVYDATNNALNRASDLPEGYNSAGVTFIVKEGTNNADSQWVITNDDGSDVVETNELHATKISGDAVYMHTDEPVPVTHGGLEAGTDINGMPVNEVLKLILFPYQYPQFTSFSIQGQPTTLEVGDKVTGGVRTFVWSTTHSDNIKPNSITIRDVTAGVDLATGLANDGTEDIDIGSDKQLTSAGTYTWRIIAENTKNQQFSRDFTVRWYYRVYWGTSANDTLTADQVKALENSALKPDFKGDYSFTNPGSQVYYYIAYPDAWGDISSWMDKDTGFAVDYEYAGTVDITNDYGVITTYRLLRTTYKQTEDLNSTVS